jgi:molybdopterin-guanine dinucleotide biosynthesis protein A
MSLLVLAGGESRRMGSPKHLLPLPGGTTLDSILDRIGGMFGDVFLVGRGDIAPREGVVFVRDIRPERCPLVGILSGLEATRNSHALVIACDMPFVEPVLVELLVSRAATGTDVVVPLLGGFHEPLCAVYSRASAGRISAYLDTGMNKTTGFFAGVSVVEVAEEEIRACDPCLRSFINLNTPGDYREHIAPDRPRQDPRSSECG